MFERPSGMVKFALHGAIVTIVQKSSACGYRYIYKTVSIVQRAGALQVLMQYFSSIA